MLDFKAFSVVFLCLALLFGSVANAAMPCCMKAQAPAPQEMQMQDDHAMPCHEAEKPSDQTLKQQPDSSCNGCDCMQIIKYNAVDIMAPLSNPVANRLEPIPVPAPELSVCSGIFQPPRPLS